MPSLLRFLFVLAVLAGLVYGAMFALVYYVHPNPGEMSIRIPSEKLDVGE